MLIRTSTSKSDNNEAVQMSSRRPGRFSDAIIFTAFIGGWYYIVNDLVPSLIFGKGATYLTNAAYRRTAPLFILVFLGGGVAILQILRSERSDE